MKQTLEKSVLFQSITLFFAGWGVLALVLAWTDVFFPWLFVCYTGIFWGIAFFSYKKTLLPRSKRILLHLSFLLILSFFLASFLQPTTFFTGRDEGSIFSAAVSLAETHSLITSSPESQAFFTLYEKHLPSRLGFSGQALNFPGFAYTNNGALTTQFPLPAIAWYASFFSLLGIAGLIIANTILLFLFFLAITLLIKSFATPKWTLIGVVLFALSFPIFWFARFTLSENFLLGFLWLFIWHTLSFREQPTQKKFFSFLLLSLLILFGRIEGFVFFGMACTALLWKRDVRQFLAEKKIVRLFMPALLFIFAGIAALSANLPFFITVIKGFFNGLGEIAVQETASVSFSHRMALFILYGIPLFTGIAGILLFMVRSLQTRTLTVLQNKNGKKTLAPFLALWITLPAFLYLFVPFISPDHPWMLRRMTFAVTPTLLFFSIFLCVFFEKHRSRFISLTLVGFLFLSSLPAFWHFFPLRQGSDLLRETQTIAFSLSENELVLVDQLTSSDGFHMLAGPLQTLFHRHAVYITNPDDLLRLDTSAFSSVSLLVPDDRTALYETQLAFLGAQKKETFFVSFSALENTPAVILSFPETLSLVQQVVLYRWEKNR